MKIPLNLVFEIAAFLVSIFCYRTMKHTPLKWFLPYLFCLVCLEIVAHYMAFVLKMHTVQLYNISIPIEYGFYIFLFYKYLHGPMIKKLALISLVFMLSFSAINLAFIQGFTHFNSLNHILCSSIVLFFCCAYFVDLFKREEEISLLREPMFWITTGALFFNMGGLSLILFWQFIFDNPDPSYATFLHMINKAMIYVLYTFISIGLICTRKPYQKTLDRSSWPAF